MKHLLFLSFAATTLMLTACSSDSELSDKDETPVDPQPTATYATLSEVQNAFAWKYFSATADILDATDHNMAVSPLSMIYALGMTANGAAGTTLSEITSALGYGGSIDALNDYCKQAIMRMQSDNDSARVNIANCVEVNSRYGVGLKADYTATVEDAYKALVEANDFSASDFKDYVNNWCSLQTDGMIPSMLDESPSDSYFILLNALCFRGVWHSKFDVNRTLESDFYLSSGQQTKACYMMQDHSFGYSETDNYQLLSMDYGNGDYAMQFILPTKGNDIQSVAKLLAAEDWSRVVADLEQCYVQVVLPRFTIDFGGENLSRVLESLGITSMFTAEADFSNLSDVGGLSASAVKQKVHVEVDEDGTRSAAVTTVIAPSSDEGEAKSFCASSPFLFVLTEKASGTILFLGQFTGQE